MNRILNAIVKRLPSHALDRAEERLLGLRPFERLDVPSPAALTITCDDGESKDLDIAAVLDRHGVKGTFAVSPDLIGRPGFLDYEQLRGLHARGHEIAFHGTTHDPFTGFRDKAALAAVCREGVRRLQAEGLGPVSTVIYPYGKHDRAVRAAMRDLFGCGFTTWFGLNRGRTNRYAIRRVPFGAYTGKLPATEAWYRQLIDTCARDGGWLTLMLHPAAEGHRSEHDALLGRLIDHARERGMPVRAANEHLAPAGGEVRQAASTASAA